jgi:hypothetical protein
MSATEARYATHLDERFPLQPGCQERCVVEAS